MKIVLYGATGMVGQGVLRECLLADDVESVVAIGRSPTNQQHPKLREIVQPNLAEVPPDVDGDACFFCLGVSSVGMAEDAYRRVTYDLTLSVARTLATNNPRMTFVYVSGASTDAAGRAMWARVKGETENALLALPFQAFMFRPGYIQPMHGITSRTRLYRTLYVVLKPLYPVLRRLAPNQVTTTEQVGQAMLTVARTGAPTRVLETRDINAI
jgi:uncharacterized protein YbjT (DUF2867 family)